MPFKLPPPPQRRGIWGLLVTVSFVIWTGYQMSTYASKKPDSQSPSVPQGPSYVEIDLRGPKYDEGRYAGFKRGAAAKKQAFTMPTDKVLAFQSTELVSKLSLSSEEATDFTAGYESGFAQAMKESVSDKITPAARQK